MSKSTGNFFTIREVTKQYHPLALRYFLLSLHYNSPVNYSLSQIDIASDAVYRIYQTLQDLRDALSSFQGGQLEPLKGSLPDVLVYVKEQLNELNLHGKAKSNSKKPSKPDDDNPVDNLKKSFESKMSDDLHTPDVLKGLLPDALVLINKQVNELKKLQKLKQKQQHQQLSTVQLLIELEVEVRKVLDVLGLLSALPYSEVLQQLKEKALIRAEMTEDEISCLIKEREAARKNKDFPRSDQIRRELTVEGIDLMDQPRGETTWRPCVPEGKDQLAAAE